MWLLKDLNANILEKVARHAPGLRVLVDRDRYIRVVSVLDQPRGEFVGQIPLDSHLVKV